MPEHRDSARLPTGSSSPSSSTANASTPGSSRSGSPTPVPTKNSPSSGANALPTGIVPRRSIRWRVSSRSRSTTSRWALAMYSRYATPSSRLKTAVCGYLPSPTSPTTSPRDRSRTLKWSLAAFFTIVGVAADAVPSIGASCRCVIVSHLCPF
jgi:hypothetical protein